MAKTEFEQKLHDEELAARRCVRALGKVDAAARRRVVRWLSENYDAENVDVPDTAESDQT